jgi:predicted AAA+ superfamily ATPase
MEILAHRSYKEADYDVQFWRTKTGNEVDFILQDGKIAVEVKGTNRVDKTDLKSLIIFQEEYKPDKAIVVCNEKLPRKHREIEILTWQDFLSALWSGDLIK